MSSLPASSSAASAIPSSPRLPSPPPPVEDLSNPASPSFLPMAAPIAAQSGKNAVTASETRRIRKGTKSKDISGPPVVPLPELDSPFQLQEHLAAIISSITNPEHSNHTLPLSRKDCEAIAKCPDGIDDWMWCYELTRRITRDLNYLVVGLLGDNCTEETCPEMRASLWQYLCAVHDPPRSCCAMDYSVHTLDHAASTLCSTKHFPSRLNISANGTKQLSSIFRRLYRIFAHAWFLHRSVFWEVENEYGLYAFFRAVSDKYNMIPEDNLTIPDAASSGIESSFAGASESAEHENRSSEHDSDLEDDGDQEFAGNEDTNAISELQTQTETESQETQNVSNELHHMGQQGVIMGDLPLFMLEDSSMESSKNQTSAAIEPSDTAVNITPDNDNSEARSHSPVERHRIEMKLDLST